MTPEQIIALVGAFGTATGMTVMYGAMFKSTAGELSDAAVKNLLQSLGWTIGWT